VARRVPRDGLKSAGFDFSFFLLVMPSASPVLNNLLACTFYGTIAPYKVQDECRGWALAQHLLPLWSRWVDRRPAASKNPADFLPPAPGQRTSAGVAERVAGSRAARHRKRSFASAMAVAGRDAPVPAIRKWLVGGTDRPSVETDGVRAALPSRRAPRRAPRVYKENAHDARG